VTKNASIISFFVVFVKKLRLSNPWKFKVPFLISILYFVYLISTTTKENPILTFFASLLVIIGISGLGYLTNDIGDRKKDAIISKENATSNLSDKNLLILFFCFFCLTLLPWFYLFFNYISLILLSLEISLFFVYAFPPFRFKEKGILGLVTDALYAHTIPALLATFTFYKMNSVAKSDIVYFTITLIAWQFILGIRNIIFHQLKDYENDINSNTKTFVTNYGVKKSTFLIKKMLLPFEFILFTVFCLILSYKFYLFACLILIYWMFKALSEMRKMLTFVYRDLAYKFLDDLYLQWLPLVVLFLLCQKSTVYLPVALLHLILFRSEAKTYLINYFKK
jgi:hypothetical protein